MVIGGRLLRPDMRALIRGHLIRKDVALILSKSKHLIAPTY